MTRALVPTGPPAISDLIRTFLDGLSPHTLTAYGRDLDDFARFLTGSRQEALGRFFSQPGIVKLTLNRQASPPMRRRPVLQLQTQVTSRQTPKARVRKSR